MAYNLRLINLRTLFLEIKFIQIAKVWLLVELLMVAKDYSPTSFPVIMLPLFAGR